jgi:hypothetical protein
MQDPYEKERELEQAAYERGEIDAVELASRLHEIDREERGDAEERAREAYDRTMDDAGFGRL